MGIFDFLAENAWKDVVDQAKKAAESKYNVDPIEQLELEQYGTTQKPSTPSLPQIPPAGKVGQVNWNTPTIPTASGSLNPPPPPAPVNQAAIEQGELEAASQQYHYNPTSYAPTYVPRIGFTFEEADLANRELDTAGWEGDRINNIAQARYDSFNRIVQGGEDIRRTNAESSYLPELEMQNAGQQNNARGINYQSIPQPQGQGITTGPMQQPGSILGALDTAFLKPLDFAAEVGFQGAKFGSSRGLGGLPTSEGLERASESGQVLNQSPSDIVEHYRNRPLGEQLAIGAIFDPTNLIGGGLGLDAATRALIKAPTVSVYQKGNALAKAIHIAEEGAIHLPGLPRESILNTTITRGIPAGAAAVAAWNETEGMDIEDRILIMSAAGLGGALSKEAIRGAAKGYGGVVSKIGDIQMGRTAMDTYYNLPSKPLMVTRAGPTPTGAPLVQEATQEEFFRWIDLNNPKTREVLAKDNAITNLVRKIRNDFPEFPEAEAKVLAGYLRLVNDPLIKHSAITSRVNEPLTMLKRAWGNNPIYEEATGAILDRTGKRLPNISMADGYTVLYDDFGEELPVTWANLTEILAKYPSAYDTYIDNIDEVKEAIKFLDDGFRQAADLLEAGGLEIPDKLLINGYFPTGKISLQDYLSEVPYQNVHAPGLVAPKAKPDAHKARTFPPGQNGISSGMKYSGPDRALVTYYSQAYDAMYQANLSRFFRTIDFKKPDGSMFRWGDLLDDRDVAKQLQRDANLNFKEAEKAHKRARKARDKTETVIRKRQNQNIKAGIKLNTLESDIDITRNKISDIIKGKRAASVDITKHIRSELGDIRRDTRDAVRAATAEAKRIGKVKAGLRSSLLSEQFESADITEVIDKIDELNALKELTTTSTELKALVEMSDDPQAIEWVIREHLPERLKNAPMEDIQSFLRKVKYQDPAVVRRGVENYWNNIRQGSRYSPNELVKLIDAKEKELGERGYKGAVKERMLDKYHKDLLNEKLSPDELTQKIDESLNKVARSHENAREKAIKDLQSKIVKIDRHNRAVEKMTERRLAKVEHITNVKDTTKKISKELVKLTYKADPELGNALRQLGRQQQKATELKNLLSANRRYLAKNKTAMIAKKTLEAATYSTRQSKWNTFAAERAAYEHTLDVLRAVGYKNTRMSPFNGEIAGIPVLAGKPVPAEFANIVQRTINDIRSYADPTDPKSKSRIAALAIEGTNAIFRVFGTTVDMGAAATVSWLYSVNNPESYLAQLRAGSKVWWKNSDSALDMLVNVKNMETYYVQRGLPPLYVLEAHGFKLGEYEFLYSELADSFDPFRDARKPIESKIMQHGALKRFQKAFITGMDVQRTHAVYETLYRMSLEGVDITDHSNIVKALSIGNMFTGRGTKPFASEILGNRAAAQAWFAGSFMRAQIDILGNAIISGNIVGSEARAALGTFATILISANYLWGQVPGNDWDPKDPFILRVAGAKIDTAGSWGTVMKSILKISDAVRSGDNPWDRRNDYLYFFRTKVAPIWSLGANIGGLDVGNYKLDAIWEKKYEGWQDGVQTISELLPMPFYAGDTIRFINEESQQGDLDLSDVSLLLFNTAVGFAGFKTSPQSPHEEYTNWLKEEYLRWDENTIGLDYGAGDPLRWEGADNYRNDPIYLRFMREFADREAPERTDKDSRALNDFFKTTKDLYNSNTQSFQTIGENGEWLKLGEWKEGRRQIADEVSARLSKEFGTEKEPKDGTIAHAVWEYELIFDEELTQDERDVAEAAWLDKYGVDMHRAIYAMYGFDDDPFTNAYRMSISALSTAGYFSTPRYQGLSTPEDVIRNTKSGLNSFQFPEPIADALESKKGEALYKAKAAIYMFYKEQNPDGTPRFPEGFPMDRDLTQEEKDFLAANRQLVDDMYKSYLADSTLSAVRKAGKDVSLKSDTNAARGIQYLNPEFKDIVLEYLEESKFLDNDSIWINFEIGPDGTSKLVQRILEKYDAEWALEDR